MALAASELQTEVASGKEALLISQNEMRSKTPQNDRVAILLGGGLSLLFFLYATVFLDRDRFSSFQLAWAMFYVSFVLNWPHFFFSYLLLYIDYRKKILTRPSYFWAGVAAPVLIAAPLIYAGVRGDGEIAGWGIRVMLFLSGWHYVKQAYGCFLVLGSTAGYTLTRVEREALRWNLLLVWLTAWCSANMGTPVYNLSGLRYSVFDLPSWSTTVGYCALVAGAFVLALLVVKKYLRDGSLPPLSASVVIVSQYVWMLPMLQHPAYQLMVPAFHSLQYLLIAGRLRKRKVSAEAKHLPEVAQRKAVLLRFATYCLATAFLGALSFHWLPGFFDRSVASDAGLGWAFYSSLSAIFINVHHFFIDSVIWRRENEDVGKFLIRRRKP